MYPKSKIKINIFFITNLSLVLKKIKGYIERTKAEYMSIRVFYVLNETNLRVAIGESMRNF